MLEVVRMLRRRYESRTSDRKRSLLKTTMITNAPVKKPEEIEKNLMNVKELMTKYEVL